MHKSNCGLEAELLRALAHPARLEALLLMQRGPVEPNEIGTALGRVQANVSQHLAVLRRAGLVGRDVDHTGRTVYSLRDRRVIVVIGAVSEMCRQRLRDELEVLDGGQDG